MTWASVLDELTRLEHLHAQVSPDPSSLQAARLYALTYGSLQCPPTAVCVDEWQRVRIVWGEASSITF